MTHFRSPPDCLELVFLADEETDVDTTAGLRDVARITGRQVQRKKNLASTNKLNEIQSRYQRNHPDSQ